MTGRVIVGFDSTPTGGNALWAAVEQARLRGAVLFVVAVTPRPVPVAPLVPPRPDWLQLEAQRQVADALLLTVGETPPELPIRVAVVYGNSWRVVSHFADHPDDVLVLSEPSRLWHRHRHRWSPQMRYCHRHCRGELFVATDATTPPVPH